MTKGFFCCIFAVSKTHKYNNRKRKKRITMEQLDYIQNLIYVIRGQRVMLDYDLARIYQVETSQLKRQVRRNKERFEGEDFMFELSHEEFLRCQIGTSSWGGGRYGVFAFTEIGVAMLSSVLRSEVAIQANRKIMRAFVSYRHLAEMPLAATYVELKKQIDALKNEMYDILADQNDINEITQAQLDAISTALAELQSSNKYTISTCPHPIGFILPQEENNIQ